MRLKNRLRMQWQFTGDPVLKAEVNHLQRPVTRRLNEWRNDQWRATLDIEDQSLWRMTKRVMRVPLHIPSSSPQGESLSRTPTKPKTLQSGGSFSAGDRSFGLGSYLDG
jgi:hypothetical protein